MPKLKDLTGMVFGRLTVLRRSDTRKGQRVCWDCTCACGCVATVTGIGLTTGHTRSCGCHQREVVAAINASHGQTDSRTYRSWAGMISRCTLPNLTAYRNYGGRGITVCDRWRHSFENFYADMGARPAKMSLDRIDVNGNYEPGNCRWATKAEQSTNTRRNHVIEFAGERLTLGEWEHRLGVRRGIVSSRLQRGWSVELALTVRPRFGQKLIRQHRRQAPKSEAERQS